MHSLFAYETNPGMYNIEKNIDKDKGKSEKIEAQVQVQIILVANIGRISKNPVK